MINNPLIFIHGAGDSTRAWQDQTAFFGTRALAIDLPGHGARPDSLPAQVSVADYARVVMEIIHEESHVEMPIVVGHSLGGLIALQMGLDFGAQLGGLVLIGTGARMRVAPVLLEAARADQEQAQKILKQSSFADQGNVALTNPLLGEQSKPQSGILYRDLVACHTFDVMDRLEELNNLPTLILCGAQERNAPVKYSEYLHQHIASSTLVIIPDAGHYVQREQPDAVNRAISEWLEKN